jgi:hypothetical protein
MEVKLLLARNARTGKALRRNRQPQWVRVRRLFTRCPALPRGTTKRERLAADGEKQWQMSNPKRSKQPQWVRVRRLFTRVHDSERVLQKGNRALQMVKARLGALAGAQCEAQSEGNEATAGG